MNLSDGLLKNEEKALFQLRELYEQYGYTRYKVSKFEEYDLYANNKNFLISENILTFTDTNGKLMALKPDVTLSIVKNINANRTDMHKLYYNETVYRTSSVSNGFHEIMQTGLECIGKVDLYSICEVLTLAQKSLALISEDYILDVSHMGFLIGFLETAKIENDGVKRLLAYMENKNASAIRLYCAENGIPFETADAICELTMLYAPLCDALPKLKKYVRGKKMQEAYDQLSGVGCVLGATDCKKRLYLDFSMVNDMNYYNGIIFRGFLNGIPDGVLSGGRYDSLLRKMGKQSDAIGFAVYLNTLSQLHAESEQYDADVLLIYNPQAEPEKVLKTASRLRATNKRVLVQTEKTEGIRFRELIYLDENGTEVPQTV